MSLHAPLLPDEAALYEAALRYLSRFAATRTGVARMLERRIKRWARMMEGTDMDHSALPDAIHQAQQAARKVIERLERSGVLDDAAFAAARTSSLTRAGRSRRAVAAHLVAKGVPSELVAQSLPDDPALELAAAVRLTKRRKLGPFAAEGPTPQARQRALAAMARAGFDGRTAQQALGMERDEAEALLDALRSGI
ncbi:Regulatory protein recX [Granulibacter bethesdensis]|uniref:Regulatory protein RecX n=1 Tax=Granulibacter bethesdensis TaxID=364410 RepID=A0AAC9KBW2_9PROT|nr:regulatory protein RecX [Granulibacter bethesdensis]APH55602.1 Regulatory protein recX [Granulibacter bethesdensis]APH63187.1 Regulatory protein recX [Granulibacter bethesdensis]